MLLFLVLFLIIASMALLIRSGKPVKPNNPIMVILLALLFFAQSANAQLYFGKATRGDLGPVTCLTLTAATDTGYATAIRVPTNCGTVVFQIYLSSVSASDSLKMECYGSNDGTVYTLLTSPSWTQMGAAGSQLVTVTNAPNYLKPRYYCIGSAISITGTITAAVKP